MKITAIAPWFGGKRTMAETIIAELGPHRAYWELFGGSAAVLLAKEPAQQETFVELHGQLVNLAKVLQEPARARDLYWRAISTLYCTDIFAASQAWLEENPEAEGIEAAYHYFVCSWMGRNGTSGCATW
jgi:DNA adenine methylase